MLSVFEAESLLIRELGVPMKSVAYAKGFKTSSGKVLAIHPTQKTPRIWHQPPIAPEIEGVTNIPPAINDDLVGALSGLKKGHGMPRVQIDTAKGLARFLAWYSGSAVISDLTEPSKHLAFAEIASKFQDLVQRKSGFLFEGFDVGMIAAWENYKPRLREVALVRLAAETWVEGSIGDGVILDHTIDAIEIQATHGDLTNNLVFWQNRFGHANRDHRALIEARANASDCAAIERFLFRLYRSEAYEAEVFDDLSDATGGKYPLLAYLFFLKDMDRFMPIQPTGFDRAFREMGIELQTLRNCSWENYSSFNSILNGLRGEIEAGFDLKNVRFIDAHSFCWLFTSLLKEEAEGVLDSSASSNERFLGAQEKSIAEIKYSVSRTVFSSNGQMVERKVKDKQLLMSDVELDKHIRQLLEVQEGRCAITGLPFQYRGRHDDENMLPSLDRIDSDGHYSRENLQLVCRFINFWKQASEDTEFRRLINIVRGIEVNT